MLKVSVWFHKDGDHLAIVQVPWWYNIVESMCLHLFCPCCGLSGWLSSSSEKAEVTFYRITNKLLGSLHKKEEHLYELPIENGCVASQVIFKKSISCFKNDCENCWHLREDAYTSKG